MGGKAKILDPKALETLYVESKRFSNKAVDCIGKIEEELSKLNDPSFRDGLSGGQGDAAKSAISGVTKAIAQLKSVLDKTARFIDDKLANAKALSQDKHGMGDAEAKAKAAAANMTLKR